MVLVCVVLLAINGWGIGLAESPGELKVLRKTNLTTLLVWGLWWPAMIGAALAFGRIWCTVCPMELLNRLADALARRVGWPRVRLGRWLRAGWLMVTVYLALQILVAGISIHRVPHYTAIMLAVLGGLAFLVGLVFREPRSFCKSFCPAGPLLSVYGRYTPIQLGIRDRSLCEACGTKDCTAPENRFRLDARSCPSLLHPYAQEQPSDCVLCFQCAKVCPQENISFGLVRPMNGFRQQQLLRPFEAVFVMLVAGFVAHEVIGEVKWLDRLFHIVPIATQSLAPAVAFGWFEAAWFLVLFLSLLWAVVAALAYVLGQRTGLRTLLLAAATGAAPIIALAHLAKAVAKVASWAGCVPLAIRDPAGVVTFQRIADHSLASPSSLASLSVLGWLMLVMIAIVGWRAWRWFGNVPNELLPATRAGFIAVAVLFAASLAVWTC